MKLNEYITSWAMVSVTIVSAATLQVVVNVIAALVTIGYNIYIWRCAIVDGNKKKQKKI